MREWTRPILVSTFRRDIQFSFGWNLMKDQKLTIITSLCLFQLNSVKLITNEIRLNCRQQRRFRKRGCTERAVVFPQGTIKMGTYFRRSDAFVLARFFGSLLWTRYVSAPFGGVWSVPKTFRFPNLIVEVDVWDKCSLFRMRYFTASLCKMRRL